MLARTARTSLVGLLALAAFLSAAAAELSPLDPAALPASWQTRAAEFAAPRNRVAPFVEIREVPLKKQPVVLDGVARLAPGRGLSLAYDDARSPLVIVDAQGLLLRYPDGRVRNPPAEAAAAASLIHALLAFDLTLLARDYALSGEEQPDGDWRLLLARRPGSEAPHRELEIAGNARRPTRLRLVRAERHVVTLDLGPPEAETAFTPEELARWFR